MHALQPVPSLGAPCTCRLPRPLGAGRPLRRYPPARGLLILAEAESEQIVRPFKSVPGRGGRGGRGSGPGRGRGPYQGRGGYQESGSDGASSGEDGERSSRPFAGPSGRGGYRPNSAGRGSRPPGGSGGGPRTPRPRDQSQRGAGYLMNEQIRFPEVRVIGEEKEPLGIMPTSQALEMAMEAEVDLVLVTPDASPPVCRLVEWSKLKFEKEKADKDAKKKQKAGVMDMKELKLRPNTDVHDYQVRLRSAQKFIQKNNKVKIVVQMRGRELQFKNQAQEMLDRFIKDLGEEAAVDQEPKLMGNQMVLIVCPPKK